MNTIDIHNGLVENQEWEARHQAKLEHIYRTEVNKYNNRPVYNNDNSNSSCNTEARISAIERRLDSIENRLSEVHRMFTSTHESESNGLFVFAPHQNVNANIALTMTDCQLQELIKSITNK